MRYNLPAIKSTYFQSTLSKLEIWNCFTQTINLALPGKFKRSRLKYEATLRSISTTLILLLFFLGIIENCSFNQPGYQSTVSETGMKLTIDREGLAMVTDITKKVQCNNNY